MVLRISRQTVRGIGRAAGNHHLLTYVGFFKRKEAHQCGSVFRERKDSLQSEVFIY